MSTLSRLPLTLAVATLLLLTGCASTGVEPSAEPPAETPSAEAEAHLESLALVADTEWTGTDEEYRDRITFLFHADGSVAHRNTAGTFQGPNDTWTVDGETITFTADYEGAFGVGTHIGRYDRVTGILDVEYTTTTNRASRIQLRQIVD